MILGVVFLLVGILGFFNMPILGVFDTNTLHNIVHLATGLIAIWAASSSESSSRMFAQWFGVIYALVTILGFIAPSFMGTLLNTNTADHILHLVLAVVLLYLGFGTKKQGSM